MTVGCTECGALVASSSRRHHMDQPHGVIPPQIWVVDVGRGLPITYVLYFPWILNLVQ